MMISASSVNFTLHLAGRIAQALFGKADEFLASAPELQMVELVAVN